MGRIVLVTGGSRSGKSAFAQRAAEALAGRRLFLATCQVSDGEMAARVRRHQEARRAGTWDSCEEPLDLEGALRAHGAHDVCLVDCLTLWVSNLLLHGEAQGRDVTEEDVVARCSGILEACASRPGVVYFVTNEVGMGIVPENVLARRFRDLAGRCNQAIAAAADEVYLVVSGVPLRVKPAGCLPT
ncbi:MAG TPA: bifunctional adenosylcobinamide kinase/adenosylcobinamide-phosphate guanylyltransferase [Candidatus Sulfotelmatobacter sp.]|nr:bifunctional adenosylcobinamide kinase/adenosylcobinamide-phosphate guanylyltransferase [Candidatus Sulfotelmatobacter sp.]